MKTGCVMKNDSNLTDLLPILRLLAGAELAPQPGCVAPAPLGPPPPQTWPSAKRSRRGSPGQKPALAALGNRCPREYTQNDRGPFPSRDRKGAAPRRGATSME